MDDQRWQQVDKVFVAALERYPEERAAFLDEACSDDPELRSRVEALLSSDGQEWDLLAKPAFETAACLLTEDQPELSTGEQLGHYRVLGLLGAGGMGEVYLAEDHQLGRKVALKVLPAGFIRSAARLQRFRQEARTASALNHPNIVTIHEVGEAEGRHFIATEYIEGETLRQRIRRDRLSVNDALDVAIQVASALAVAHQAGIIHRDIKPENLMLRSDGYVKVLDFGLAKLIEQPPSIAGAEAPGEAKTSDSSAFLMGTPRYMSPEQALGGAVDARSDIFGLGVVLYEMITGRRPFDGSTPEEVIASMLEEEPPPLTNFVPDLPEGLQDIISGCLSKNKDERYQSAKDLLANLKDLGHRLERQAELEHSSSAQTNISIIGESRRQRLRTVMILAGLGLVAASLFALFWFARAGKRAAAFQNITITKLAASGVSRDAAISPDGKYVAYVVEEPAQQTIWMKEVATEAAAQLVPPGAGRLAALTFSRDSNELFYARYEKGSPSDTLYRMSVAGGPATRVLAEVHSPVSFSPDGKRFAFFRRYEGRNALLIANADGTEERELTSPSSPERLWDYPCGPAWSPDGQVIFCASYHLEGMNKITTFVGVSVGGGAERTIPAGDLEEVTGLAWLADGSGLLMSALEGPGFPGNRQIWHISYPSGEVRRITSDFTDYSGVSITSGSNVMVSSQQYVTTNIWVSPGENPSQVRLINSPRSLYIGLSWTADGRIVYSQRTKEGADLWVMNQDGTNREQLTINSGINFDPSVTPDGKYIVFLSDRSGSGGIWRMDIDGQNPKQLAEANDPPTCSPDGRWVFFQNNAPGTDEPRFSLWRVPINGGEPVQILADSLYQPAISPDGKFVAYIYRESDAIPDAKQSIEVIPSEGGKVIKRFPIPEGLFTPGLETGMKLTWSADGQALFYIGSNLWRQPIDGSPPKQLTNFQGEPIVFYAWSPNGKQLACICVIVAFDTVLIYNKK